MKTNIVKVERHRANLFAKDARDASYILKNYENSTVCLLLSVKQPTVILQIHPQKKGRLFAGFF